MKNRREFLFVYDVSWANPNGDPLDENKPRIDEETGINYVTDVRLKRTIRDQLVDMGYEVFIREERKEDGKLSSKEDIFSKYENDYAKVLEKCIDIRLFGGTFALKSVKKSKGKTNESEGQDNEETKQTASFTGPVQFKFGKSLNRVKMELVKGTTVMPSGEGKGQGTMTEVYVLPYSLIVFYGIANEKAAKDTNLKDEDIEDMLKAMWLGHKSSTDVISRSKFGHSPRLLIEIIYKENTLTHIGELDKLLSFKSDKRDEEIRDIEELELDLSKLKDKIAKYKDKIEKVRFSIDDRVKFSMPIESLFEGVAYEQFPWVKEV
ncbi:type I-B CRISPR-associated protein Cas7/Csh2 [Hydrogenobaculum acidophilum]